VRMVLLFGVVARMRQLSFGISGRVVSNVEVMKLYEGMNIARTAGLTFAQKATLKALGPLPATLSGSS